MDYVNPDWILVQGRLNGYGQGPGPRECKIIFISVTTQKTQEWNSWPCHVYKHEALRKQVSISLESEACEDT